MARFSFFSFMSAANNSDSYHTAATTFSPVRVLRVDALGAELAFDAAALYDVLDLAEAHAPVRYGRGLVMCHEGGIIPLVDYRALANRGRSLVGAKAVVAKVQCRRFALLVDRVKEQVKVDYAELRVPDRALSKHAPYLSGCIWRDEREVYLIDLERLLGPAIRTYLGACE